MRLEILAIEAFLGTKKLPALISRDKPVDYIEIRKINSDAIALSLIKFLATVRILLPLITSKQIAFSSGPSATYCDLPQIPKAPNKKKPKIKTVSMFAARARNIIAFYQTVMTRSYLQNQTNSTRHN